MVHCIQISFMFAVIGYVYSTVLIQPGQVLGWWYKLLYRMLTKTVVHTTPVPDELKGTVAPTVTTTVKEHWLLKPLGACEKCVSGQMAFWYSVQEIIKSDYSQSNCIFTVITKIFTVLLLSFTMLVSSPVLAQTPDHTTTVRTTDDDDNDDDTGKWGLAGLLGLLGLLGLRRRDDDNDRRRTTNRT